MEHRLTGYLATARAMTNSFGKVMEVLDKTVSHGGDSTVELRQEAGGIGCTCTNVDFVYLGFLMRDVLCVLEPGNTVLQSKGT